MTVATFLLLLLAGMGAWVLLKAVLGKVGTAVTFLGFSAVSLVASVLNRHWWTATALCLTTAYWSIALLVYLRERELRGQR